MNTATIVTCAALVVVVAGGAVVAGGQTREAPCRLPHGSESVRLDPAAFTTQITNPWWPMRVGSRWVYRETAPDGTMQRDVVTIKPHQVIVVGILAAAALVASLLILVQLITRSV